MDVHVPRAITEGVRLRAVDVLTAKEDGARQLGDAELLDRATVHGRVLFTRDADLLTEAGRRQADGRHFGGVVYAQAIAGVLQRWRPACSPACAQSRDHLGIGGQSAIHEARASSPSQAELV